MLQTISFFTFYFYCNESREQPTKIITIMKNLSLFVTLGFVTLMGAITPVNANPVEENPADSTVQLNDSPTIDENGNVILEQPELESIEEAEAPAEEEIVYDPALDTDGDGQLSEAEIEAAAALEEAPAE